MKKKKSRWSKKIAQIINQNEEETSHRIGNENDILIARHQTPPAIRQAATRGIWKAIEFNSLIFLSLAICFSLIDF